MSQTMKAVLIDKITKAEEVDLSDVAIPEVKPGWVLIKVKAFGMNHSEQILRLEEIEEDYIKKPVIPGIECVGLVENPSDSDLEKGQKVVALMGGMGRRFDGSYAEYALLPRDHVFAVESSLSWSEIAAIPETYYTAWGSLFECLNLKPDDTLLVRGGTCALGYAAIQLAKAYGCRVLATTHREAKLKLLEDAGADRAVLDSGEICGELKSEGVTKVLELVGPKTVPDSLKCLSKGGICCNTGILGNVYTLNDFDPITGIPNGAYLTGFYSNYPRQEDIGAIFSFMEEHKLHPRMGEVFKFEDIKDACRAQDYGRADGKIVVTVGGDE